MSAGYKTHVFRYRHDGADWVLKIDATDAADAHARIGKLVWATYDGVALSETPIILAPFGMLAIWSRNTLVRLVSRFLPPRA
jgi:hypothetical protein